MKPNAKYFILSAHRNGPTDQIKSQPMKAYIIIYRLDLFHLKYMPESLGLCILNQNMIVEQVTFCHCYRESKTFGCVGLGQERGGLPSLSMQIIYPSPSLYMQQHPVITSTHTPAYCLSIQQQALQISCHPGRRRIAAHISSRPLSP